MYGEWVADKILILSFFKRFFKSLFCHLTWSDNSGSSIIINEGVFFGSSIAEYTKKVINCFSPVEKSLNLSIPAPSLKK